MILPGNSSTGATKSASPASIALLGMPSTFGRSWFLHKGHAPFFLDGLQAQRAVGAHP